MPADLVAGVPPSAHVREASERPRPRPEPEPEAEPAPVPSAAAPQPGAAGVAAGASSGAEGAATAALRDDYWAAVRAAIARAQVYPRAARSRGVEGAALLHLVVGRDGHLRSARLVRSSGAAVLDRAGLDAARRASLPVPPPGLGDADLDFAVTLRFQIE